MREKPLVSVIIPCYNAEKYVEIAVRSIMNQTYKNLEIIITDDCSTDRSFIILQKLVAEDFRIRLYRNDTNLNIVKTLNNMILLANGKYIARMDADDISFPRRIEKQVEFLENHPDCAICGTNGSIIDKDSCIIGKTHVPIDSYDVELYSKYGNPFLHPSVMLCSEIYKQNLYNENFLYAEDYELWKRILKIHKAHNLKETLIKYRIIKTSLSNNSETGFKQKEIFLKISSTPTNDIFKIKGIATVANLLMTRKKIGNDSFYIPILYKLVYILEKLSFRVIKCIH